MGHSVRTERYRLTEWTAPVKEFQEYELYDYTMDPQGNQYLANQAEHADTVKAWRSCSTEVGVRHCRRRNSLRLR